MASSIETKILSLLADDSWMMDILKAVRKLNLPDSWVGAGFVRSKVWDHRHKYKTSTPLPDIDVIYFNKSSVSKKDELEIERILKEVNPELNWSVKNQARMHEFHNDEPYKNSEVAISHWVETATCIGVRLNSNNKPEIIAPYGVDDLWRLILRPSPFYYTNLKIFSDRVKSKKWLEIWPKLKIATNFL